MGKHAAPSSAQAAQGAAIPLVEQAQPADPQDQSPQPVALKPIAPQPQATQPKRRKRWPIVLVIVLVVLLAGVGGCVLAYNAGALAGTPLEGPVGAVMSLFGGQKGASDGGVGTSVEVDEFAAMDEGLEAAAERAASHDGFPTPVVAEYDGVLFHSPIHLSQLNGLLFHQSAVPWGLTFETKLPAADEAKVNETKDYGFVPLEEQPEGDEYLIGSALHLWRRGESTAMDSSLDVGAEAGDPVYAPVTGTVVLVRTYKLYDEVDDFEIHIQPDGHPDLDVVEIHITDVSVKAGDHVEGGVTPMAKVRNLAAAGIDGIQLAYYTKAGHGNHTHVQVNDTNYIWPGQDEKKDEGTEASKPLTYRDVRLIGEGAITVP